MPGRLREPGYAVDGEDRSDRVTLQPIHTSKAERTECVLLLRATKRTRRR